MGLATDPSRGASAMFGRALAIGVDYERITGKAEICRRRVNQSGGDL
jgi:hypothetical protein